MSVKERDQYTGHMTTGHEWNGISELNTRVPAVLLFFLAAAVLFAIGYWYLMPAWPTGNDYTRGKLGVDQKDVVNRRLAEATALQGIWSDRFNSATYAEILEDPDLMQVVFESGPALFRDNCAMCHGQQGEGGLYFPRLTDNSWLWGDAPENIYTTLSVGINSGVENSRAAMMPAFGDFGILNSEQVTNIATFIRSLGNEDIGSGSLVNELLAVNQGRAEYAQFCVACHGAEGQGNSSIGAPNLADDYWIYGSDQQSVETSIQQGRAGHMPAWQNRLDETELKILSLYVAGLDDSVHAVDSGSQKEK